MTHDRSRGTIWRDAWPGLGLVFGAGLGLVVALLLPTDSPGLIVGLAVGAGLGLMVGAVARGVSGGGPQR